MKLAIVEGLKAFTKAFKEQFTENCYQQARKIVEKHDKVKPEIVEPKMSN